MIEVRLGEVAAVAADAYLRPITSSGAAATSLSRRLEIAAGPAPAEQLRHFGEVPVGSALITAAGELSARFLIHIVIRSVELPVTADSVRRGLTNALRRLDEWGIESVALPLLGTGAGCLAPEEAVEINLPVLSQSLRQRPRQLVIVAESEYELELVTRELDLQGRAPGAREVSRGPLGGAR